MKIIAGADLPATCKIGGGLILQHGAKGVIIHDKTVIGNDVTIFHQVTIGVKAPSRVESDKIPPIIGDRVLIGAGAKIIGNIKVGHDVLIGSNAVVVHDVPSNSTAVGIPAKVVLKK